MSEEFNWKGITGPVEERLENAAKVNDLGRDMAQRAIRDISRTIRALHHGEEISSTGISSQIEAIRDLIQRTPDLAGARWLDDVFQEFVELKILEALVAGQAPPAPDDLGVDDGPYLLGMADTVGELRRQTVQALKDADMLKARLRFEQMESLERAVAGVHLRLDGLRRKQDVARSLVERTRGELTIALRLHRLEVQLREESE